MLNKKEGVVWKSALLYYSIAGLLTPFIVQSLFALTFFGVERFLGVNFYSLSTTWSYAASAVIIFISFWVGSVYGVKRVKNKIDKEFDKKKIPLLFFTVFSCF